VLAVARGYQTSLSPGGRTRGREKEAPGCERSSVSGQTGRACRAALDTARAAGGTNAVRLDLLHFNSGQNTIQRRTAGARRAAAAGTLRTARFATLRAARLDGAFCSCHFNLHSLSILPLTVPTHTFACITHTTSPLPSLFPAYIHKRALLPYPYNSVSVLSGLVAFWDVCAVLRLCLLMPGVPLKAGHSPLRGCRSWIFLLLKDFTARCRALPAGLPGAVDGRTCRAFPPAAAHSACRGCFAVSRWLPYLPSALPVAPFVADAGCRTLYCGISLGRSTARRPIRLLFWDLVVRLPHTLSHGTTFCMPRRSIHAGEGEIRRLRSASASAARRHSTVILPYHSVRGARHLLITGFNSGAYTRS